LTPFYAIISGIILIIVTVLIFLPKVGIIARIRRLKRDRNRITIEDALKHLYDCEFKKLDCSLNSLIGNLGLKPNEIAKVISTLESMSLITSFNGKIILTKQGKDYAAKVVRIHRLWERYLAENTSVDENEWHIIAEEKEHETTDEAANWLSAKLGNPLVDPHGDPIPNANGEIQFNDGIAFNNLTEGKYARIIHLEDEPKEVYAQLTALGLYPGMQLKVLQNTKDKIRFLADGNECLLAPVLAANLTVQEVNESEIEAEDIASLASLETDECGIVVGISNAMRGQQRRRMLDFGIVPGTKIYARLKSLQGDPSAFEVRGALIALRKNQSDLIHIKRLKK